MSIRLIPFLLLFVFTIFDKNGFAQDINSLVLINSETIDPHRYDAFKGSPYLFKKFVAATIVSHKGERIEVEQLNYNSYSHNVEVRKDDQFIELNPKKYIRVEIPIKGNPILEKEFGREQIFLHKNIHPSLKNKFSDLLYHGKNFVFLKDLHVALKDNEVNTPGALVAFKRFSEAGKYYILSDNKLKYIRLNKKQLIRTLGYRKELTAFIKKNKTDFKSDVAVIELMKYYDSLIGK